MGGKKVSDKTLVINNLIGKCDYLLLGGGMCFTFFKALGKNIGDSIVDNDNINYCRDLLTKYSKKIVLPLDVITQNGEIKDINDMKEHDIGYDIGPKTNLKFNNILKNIDKVPIEGATVDQLLYGLKFDNIEIINGINKIIANVLVVIDVNPAIITAIITANICSFPLIFLTILETSLLYPLVLDKTA